MHTDLLLVLTLKESKNVLHWRAWMWKGRWRTRCYFPADIRPCLLYSPRFDGNQRESSRRRQRHGMKIPSRIVPVSFSTVFSTLLLVIFAPAFTVCLPHISPSAASLGGSVCANKQWSVGQLHNTSFFLELLLLLLFLLQAQVTGGFPQETCSGNLTVYVMHEWAVFNAVFSVALFTITVWGYNTRCNVVNCIPPWGSTARGVYLP